MTNLAPHCQHRNHPPAIPQRTMPAAWQTIASQRANFAYNPPVTAASLKIGNLELATPLLLAPIAGYCDLAFRLVARSCGGGGAAWSGLLSPEGVLRATPQMRR